MKTDKQKQAILIMRRQGASYSQIAGTLALSPNTVKSICRRNGIRADTEIEIPADRCRNCGGTLEQTPGKKKKIFCSDRCRYAWWNRKRCRQPYHLACYCCGREFISYGNRKRKYCGRECYSLSRYGEGLP